jgi:hypothetical protein
MGLIVATASVCLTLLAAELALRAYHGRLLQWQSVTAPSTKVGRMVYHPVFGWTPRPGTYGTDWTSTVDAAGIRSNGRTAPMGRPVLVVGDSFAFGDEVGDSETWAAYLEEMLERPVLNAGVGAYGLDQAVLRAELLMRKHEPAAVILAFISHDINRTEFAFYPYAFRGGWKPYFGADMSLHNVPVPQDAARPARRLQVLRRVLGYSLLANAILSRVAPLWWFDVPIVERVHHAGIEVSVALLVRLHALGQRLGVDLLAVGLATNGRIGDNARIAPVVERLRAHGVPILDLSGDMQALPQFPKSFQRGGHYTPAMNRYVAERIAAVVR